MPPKLSINFIPESGNVSLTVTLLQLFRIRLHTEPDLAVIPVDTFDNVSWQFRYVEVSHLAQGNFSRQLCSARHYSIDGRRPKPPSCVDHDIIFPPIY